MLNVRAWLRWLAPLATTMTLAMTMTLATGCAPTYHSYSGCHVNCKYCAPPPLPYAHYEGCVCHSCAASKYLSVEPQPTNEDVDIDTDQ